MDESIELQKPEKFRFTGPVNDEQRVSDVEHYLETTDFPRPPESEKNAEREQQVVAIKMAVLDFAKEELGIDLSKRMPPNSKFHFYDIAGYQKVKDMYNKENSEGTCTTSGHILSQEGETDEATLGRAQHELIHVASHRTVNICEIEGGKLWIDSTQSGYGNEKNQALAMVDEALTEMTNLEIMATYWNKQEVLIQTNPENYGKIGYPEQVIVMDELIKRIADKNGREYKDVLRDLQRGKFIGEMQALRVLTDEIGTDGMKIISRWGMDSGSDDSIKIARALGLTEAEAKINLIRRSQDVNVMDRISPNIVQKGIVAPDAILKWRKEMAQKTG